MRDTQYTLYTCTPEIYIKRLRRRFLGFWIIRFPALSRLRAFSFSFLAFFFPLLPYFSGTASRWKSPGENAVCIQSAVTSPLRPIVSRLIRDVMYREREIRCNESRCHGRIKASRKLIRRIPDRVSCTFADELLPLEPNRRNCVQPHTYDFKCNVNAKQDVKIVRINSEMIYIYI